MAKIAFIGLGNMGLPMATNLVKAGHEVSGHDLSAEARAAFAKAGGRDAASLAEAVTGAEVVVTMLPAGPHVRAAYLEPGGILDNVARGTLLVDSSTVEVETARLVAGVAAERGMAMVDAPVSGGVGGATNGTLTFMVGGSEEDFGRAQPILAAMGKTIVHTGAAGTGQAAKICNNMILGITMAAVSEAFVLADKLGLDAQKLFDVSSRSSGQCWALTSYCPVPGPVPTAPSNSGYRGGFAAALMLKDLKLAQRAAQTVGAAVPLGSTATQLYQMLGNANGGGRDFSYVYEWLRTGTAAAE
jgi:3-hydroxyisobutyrate dehydrogenase